MALSGKNFDFSGPGGSLYYCDGDAKSTTACGTSGFTIRNYTYHTWLRTNSFKTGGKNVTKIRLWAHDTSATSHYGYKGILGLSSTLYNPSDYSSSIPSFTYSGQTGTNYYETYTYNTYYVDLDVNLNPNTDYYMYVGVASGGAWQAVNYSSSSRYTHYYVEFLTSSQATYSITYDNNGGSGGPGSVTMNWGSGILSATKPTRTGYTFKNWNTKADGSGTSYAAGASYTATSNATLYAQWTPYKLTVIYNANGGTQTSGNSYTMPYTTSADYGSNYNGTDGLWNISTFGLSKTGYSPKSNAQWNTKSDGSGTSINQATSYTAQALATALGLDLTTANRSTTLYANWIANTYTVTFDKNNGDSVSQASKSVTYNSTYGTLPTASRAGYTFAGWYTAASGGTQVTSTTKVTITAAQTLYAHWTVNSYTFTLGSSTGVSTSGSTTPGSQNYGTTITLKATVSSGYTWSKWQSSNTTLQNDLSTANTTFTMPAGDIMMTPVAMANGYTIVFNGNGATGGSMNNMTCSYGTSYNLTTNGYTKTGYEFLGWSTDSSATTATYTNGQSISNLTSTNGGTITLYAIWEAKSQTFIWAYDSNQKKYRWHRALKYVFAPDTLGNPHNLIVNRQTSTSTTFTYSVWVSNSANKIIDETYNSKSCTIYDSQVTYVQINRKNGNTTTCTITSGTANISIYEATSAYKVYAISNPSSDLIVTYSVSSNTYEM